MLNLRAGNAAEKLLPNNAMDIDLVPLEVDDFLDCGWKTVVEECDEEICNYLAHDFARAANDAKVVGETGKASALLALARLFALDLDVSNKADPYTIGTSTVYIDKYSQQLVKAAPCFDCDEIKARVADLMFIYANPRHYPSSLVAIDAYIRCASSLISSDKAIYAPERIHRACALARQINNKDKLTTATNFIIQVIDELAPKAEDAVCLKLLKVLSEYPPANPEKYVELSGAIADRLLSDGNFMAEHYYEVKTRWAIIAKDNGGRQSGLLGVAESCLARAESSSSAMAKASWMNQAIQKLRQAGKQEDKIAIIRKDLTEVQRKIPDEMSSFEIPLELEAQQAKISEYFEGKDWLIALLSFAKQIALPSVKAIKEGAKKEQQTSILGMIGAAFYVNHEGKTVAKGANVFEDPDTALREIMYRQADLSRLQYGVGFIDPARRVLEREHRCLPQDFLCILQSNPFVERGRIDIYARGLSYGMHGDFIESMHLLIPQFENSLRKILTQNDVIPTGHDQNGIQLEWSLNTILDEPKLTELLGEDIVWHSKCLLTDDIGENWRNQMAHGLLDFQEFEAVNSLYIWWLILHVLCLPLKLKNDESD